MPRKHVQCTYTRSLACARERSRIRSRFIEIFFYACSRDWPMNRVCTCYVYTNWSGARARTHVHGRLEGERKKKICTSSGWDAESVCISSRHYTCNNSLYRRARGMRSSRAWQRSKARIQFTTVHIHTRIIYSKVYRAVAYTHTTHGPGEFILLARQL